MLISYILPCYNVEKYIVNCLDSIYHQGIDEEQFEVICVNDGSKDATERIIADYAENHSNLVLHSIENSGLSIARNTGFELSRGRYVFFVDSDDFIAQNSIKSVLECIVDTDADLVFFDWLRINDENSNKDCRFSDYQKSNKILDGKKYFYEYFPGNGVWQFAVKKQFMLDNNIKFIEGRYFEDGMFVIDCISRAKTCIKCESDVYRYVKRANSITTSINYDHLRKVIDDFLFAILHFNEYVKAETCEEQFVERLIDRRNSYTFHLQVRMARWGTKKDKLDYILKTLKDNGCYPYTPIDRDYKGFLHKFLYKIFQKQKIFRFIVRFQYRMHNLVSHKNKKK